MEPANSDGETSIGATKKRRSTGFYFVVVLLFIFVLRWAVVEPYVIPSESMIPTLLVNDHIFVNKLRYGIRWPFSKSWIFRWGTISRGDIIVFRSTRDDGYFMVKRVVGIAGDKIRYDESGQLFVNDRLLKRVLQKNLESKEAHGEYYPVVAQDIGGEFDGFDIQIEDNGALAYRTMIRADGFRWAEKETIVPEDQLYVMGDYRDASQDSRSWGALPQENVLGQAMFVWLSCYQTLDSLPYVCDPRFFRWSRLFHWLR